MGILDQVLGQVAGGADVAGLAAKVGLTPQQVDSAVQALGRALGEPGDTAGLAAAKTGLPVDKVQQLLAHIGGESGLGSILGGLGDGGGLGKLAGLWGSGARDGGA